MRRAALEPDSSFGPEGESAEPSGPWKPWVERETEISAPAGRTAQPAGVTRVTAPAAADGTAARTRASAGSPRRMARFIDRRLTPGTGIRRGGTDGSCP